MESQEYDKQQKKMQDEIKTLQSEFHSVSSDIKSLNHNHLKVQENVDAICGNLDKISHSVETMMEKINLISEAQQKNAVDNLLHRKGGLVPDVLKKTMRKVAVGTIGTVMLLGEYSAEKLSCTREGLEDIIAEASYNNKMRKQNQSIEG